MAGAKVDGTLQGFEELDTGKLRNALLELLDNGDMPTRLDKQRVGERRGRLRT